MSLNKLTLTQAIKNLQAKKCSAFELVKACLDQINRYDSKIHAFLELNQDALKEAKLADNQRRDNSSPLLGIPIAIKDNFLTQNLPTTAASKVLEGYLPQYESTVTRKLKEAGAIIIGKTNMDAWAHGSSTESSDFGPTLNPWNTQFLPGGSSGGSTAAVAADMCIAAIGSETAGSIRLPAAWCGVTGFKPTYGRVSRYGVIAMASSTDSPGPIAKTVEDCAFLTQIIGGFDPYDATSSSNPVPLLTLSKAKVKTKLKIGLPKEYLEAMNQETKALVHEAIKVLQNQGHVIEPTSLISPKYAIGVYTIVQRSEVSSNLSRYDGIRYGQDRTKFGEEAIRRIMLGTFALSSGYYDQYYSKAQKVRTLIIEDFNQAFKKFDLIINPPSPGPALKIGASKNEPLFGEMQDMLVEPSSVAGLTGVSLPGGFVDGLPFGFGFVGPQFSEDKVLNIAHQYQQATDWHLRKPQL
ncbi:MAG: Asp-tRNA(Asn)/Glu-tRNA(Gln) amidotransferase subunit GatA [Candidatus Chisholmbacteria bacterium]|nr:Asp-tRNA(Asn)/Glu-tRNA(Gln) amidotransferase subunit GatA [Candidatus Chisholmbacteria bacterium]